jgi:hypothetical protein
MSAEEVCSVIVFWKLLHPSVMKFEMQHLPCNVLKMLLLVEQFDGLCC